MVQIATAAIIEEHGGPEQFRIEELDLPEPGPGDILIRHKAIGPNYIEVCQRTGPYKMTLPSALRPCGDVSTGNAPPRSD